MTNKQTTNQGKRHETDSLDGCSGSLLRYTSAYCCAERRHQDHSCRRLGPVVTAVKPAFEKESGHKLDITFVSGPVVKREVEGGRAFDIAISQPEIIDELIQGGKVSPAPAPILRAPASACR